MSAFRRSSKNGSITSATMENLQPITGLCIVAHPSKCPPGYDLIYRSFDKNDDCDLWKDQWLRQRITRYLCYSRSKPQDNGRPHMVLTDVAIKSDNEATPNNYQVIQETVDTKEKATRKKHLYVKMSHYSDVTSAISELIVLSGNKRAPAGYTLIGEMNNLMLCYKIGKLDKPSTPTAGTPTTPQSEPRTQSQPAAATSPATETFIPNQYRNRPDPNEGCSTIGRQRALAREDSVVSTVTDSASASSSFHFCALSGVCLQLNPHLAGAYNTNQIGNLAKEDTITLGSRSRADIENEFFYTFTIERTVGSQDW